MFWIGVSFPCGLIENWNVLDFAPWPPRERYDKKIRLFRNEWNERLAAVSKSIVKNHCAEIEEMINKYAKRAGFALAFMTLGAAGVAVAQQAHMVNALSALQTAKAELAVAEQNKGGHRSNALNLVNQAIDEVNKGINYADTH